MYAQGMVDRDIMEALHLKRPTYYWYRKRLFKESADLFKQTSNDELMYHKDLLQERLTTMYSQIQTDLRDNTISNKDRAGLYMAAQSYAMNIFRLNYEGIVALRNAYEPQRRPPTPTPLTSVNTPVGSESDTGSGSGVIRLLQTEDTNTTGTAGTTTSEDSSIPNPVNIEKQEPDESEIY